MLMNEIYICQKNGRPNFTIEPGPPPRWLGSQLAGCKNSVTKNCRFFVTEFPIRYYHFLSIPEQPWRAKTHVSDYQLNRALSEEVSMGLPPSAPCATAQVHRYKQCTVCGALHELWVCEGTSVRLGARTPSLSKEIWASCDHWNFILEINLLLDIVNKSGVGQRIISY